MYGIGEPSTEKDAFNHLSPLIQGRITAELVVLFHAGLNGNRSIFMPHARMSIVPGGLVASSKSFGAALYDVLDAPPIFDHLRLIFAESQCPLVAELKAAMARRYADDNASDLAELELENEQ